VPEREEEDVAEPGHADEDAQRLVVGEDEAAQMEDVPDRMRQPRRPRRDSDDCTADPGERRAGHTCERTLLVRERPLGNRRPDELDPLRCRQQHGLLVRFLACQRQSVPAPDLAGAGAPPREPERP
jgi:hypothetical protein